MELAFILNQGGLGDFIHWTTAIQYAIETNNHISGLVATPAYFADLARHWFAQYADRFQIYIYREDELNKDPVLKRIKRRANNIYNYLTTTTFHLLAVGFGVYALTDRIPKAWEKLPLIVGNETPTNHFIGHSNYVVVTTEATSKVRTLSASTVNEITEWLKKRGILPVFLGKKELEGNYKSGSDQTINVIGVHDLREETTLLEAACILANARAVVGLDNGLLHLACCSDVPVAFAFTSVDPRHRIPPRREGARTITITPPEELQCRFCQSNIRFLEHQFTQCLYGDEMCCKLMTSAAFIEALEAIL